MKEIYAGEINGAKNNCNKDLTPVGELCLDFQKLTFTTLEAPFEILLAGMYGTRVKEKPAPKETKPEIRYETADQAVYEYIAKKWKRHMREGNTEPVEAYFPEACMYPEPLGKALQYLAYDSDYKCNVRNCHLDGDVDWGTDIRCKGKNNEICYFVSPNFAKTQALEQGLIDYKAISLYDAAIELRSGMLDGEDREIDTALLQVSEPFPGDDGEWCVSYGIGGVISKPVVERILERKRDRENPTDATIVALVNKQVPKTNLRIKISDIDCFVGKEGKDGTMEMYDTPLPEHKPSKQNAVTRAISRNAVKAMPQKGEGIAALQFGIGPITEGTATGIAESEDIDEVIIHTELATDGVVDLIKAGKVKKTVVAGFANGSNVLYNYVREHPEMFIFESGTYVNDPYVISEIDNFRAFNCALGVDFPHCQIFATTINGKVFKGEGGSRNFALGAERSKGGKFVILFESRRFDKKTGQSVSKILPEFAPGDYATETGSEAGTIGTEWGIVDVRKKSQRRRTELLISIAHPIHRVELALAAQERKLLEHPEFFIEQCRQEEKAYNWIMDTFGKEVKKETEDTEICGDKADVRGQVFELISRRKTLEEREELIGKAAELGVADSLAQELMREATPGNGKILAKICSSEPIKRYEIAKKAIRENSAALPRAILQRIEKEAAEDQQKKTLKKKTPVIYSYR